LLALRNILHGSIFDVTGLGNGNLLLTMRRIIDVALSGVLLQIGALPGEVASMTAFETDIARGGSNSG
jgi:hypothetical protein